MRITPLINRASAFAEWKHIDHARKYTNLPYFTHLRNVAHIVASVTNDEEVIAAAFLHDTLEDTATSYDELVAEFGGRVADLVREVTDVYTSDYFPFYNRQHRKLLERQRLADTSADAQTIKLADLIDNSRDIVKHDPGFARKYLAEKRALLDVMKLGDPILWDEASKQADGENNG